MKSKFNEIDQRNIWLLMAGGSVSLKRMAKLYEVSLDDMAAECKRQVRELVVREKRRARKPR